MQRFAFLCGQIMSVTLLCSTQIFAHFLTRETFMAQRDGFRVLIIEDDPDTQANLRDILELDGFQIEIAASVRETLVERDWSQLFAIILDRRLPDGTADTLLPKLRELRRRHR